MVKLVIGKSSQNYKPCVFQEQDISLRKKWKAVQVDTLCEKCPYSEIFWSVFSRIWTEYEEIRSVSPYSVIMPENKDQKNSEYGHFSRSATEMFGKRWLKEYLSALTERKSWQVENRNFKIGDLVLISVEKMHCSD